MSKDRSTYGPLHASAPTHPKVYAVAERLSLPPPYAFGLMASLWARALSEAPDGVIRGGDRRLASLCLWDGDPAALREALVSARVLVEAEGQLAIHEWHLYGGESLRQRNSKADRLAKGRAALEAKKLESESGPRLCRDVSVETSLQISSPLSDLRSDPDPELARPVPVSTPAQVSKPQIGRQTPRSMTIHGMAEEERRPKSPEAVCADPHYGPILREKFPALDGGGSRPTLVGDVTARFRAFSDKHQRDGRDAAFNALIGWIGKDYGAHERSKKFARDGPTSFVPGKPNILKRDEVPDG